MLLEFQHLLIYDSEGPLQILDNTEIKDPASPKSAIFFKHTFFRLHDEGPAGSSYPAGGKPTARMAIASAGAVGSAPLLQRGRAHGLAPGPVAGSRAVARARGCRAPWTSGAELWVSGSLAPLGNSQHGAVVRRRAGLRLARSGQRRHKGRVAA